MRRLAEIQTVFDTLATSGVLPFNAAGAVRGLKHVAQLGQPPVLAPDQARAILKAIDTSTPTGLRDRAFIRLMVYNCAWNSAATGMGVQGRLYPRIVSNAGPFAC